MIAAYTQNFKNQDAEKETVKLEDEEIPTDHSKDSKKADYQAIGTAPLVACVIDGYNVWNSIWNHFWTPFMLEKLSNYFMDMSKKSYDGLVWNSNGSGALMVLRPDSGEGVESLVQLGELFLERMVLFMIRICMLNGGFDSILNHSTDIMEKPLAPNPLNEAFEYEKTLGKDNEYMLICLKNLMVRNS